VPQEWLEEVVVDWWRAYARNRANSSSLSQTWNTDARYIEAARRVLGGIDLDPASNVLANKTVRATTFYTEEDDGLAKEHRPWRGRVWMNPPFAGMAGDFVNALIEDYRAGHVEAAVALLNGRNYDKVWFRPLFDFPICWASHRAVLRNPLRPSIDRPSMSGAFVYFGPHPIRFAEEFAQFGPVMNEKAASRERRQERLPQGEDL
jgi:hypothetical protein